MTDATTDLIERPDSDERQASPISKYVSYLERDAQAAGLARHSVYEKRLTETPNPWPGFEKEPHTVYFYYVRLDTDGRLRVKHYTQFSAAAIPHASLQTVVQGLVDNVRNETNNPPRDGKNFENIEWTRKSYIAFFVDEENWSLHTNGDPLDGIRFDNSTTPNHTFFDAKDLTVTVRNRRSGALTQRSAIAFVNHMKRDDNGNDLVLGDRQPFKFEMIFDVKFADASNAPIIVIFDPDGTNVGPPVPPPA
jgi:hypothetical protein